MKASTLLLTGSLVVNTALLIAFAVKPALLPSGARAFFVRDAETNERSPATQATQAAQAATQAAAETARVQKTADALANYWSTLESDDLPTLIAHLRAAGFSPAVVRSIVDARINQRFASRMKALTGSFADTPFWKPEPTNSINNPRFFEEMNQIYRDRMRLLRDLLGNDFFAHGGSDPTAVQRRQYGDLSPQKIDLVQRIVDDYAELTSQARSAMQGITLPEDREKLALLEREKRADLAALLTPAELEAYEMRTSPTANRLRVAFTFMDATEDEFRTIYRIQQPLTDTMYPTGGIVSPDFAQQRREAQQKIAEQIKAALGEARYADFARASNYEFQQLSRLAARDNIPTETAVRVYNLREGVAQESNRIYNDANQSADQKRTALQALAQATKGQIVSSLGTAAGNAYVQTANWLSQVERGGAVTFGPDGTMASARFVPNPSATPPAPR